MPLVVQSPLRKSRSFCRDRAIPFWSTPQKRTSSAAMLPTNTSYLDAATIIGEEAVNGHWKYPIRSKYYKCNQESTSSRSHVSHNYASMLSFPRDHIKK